MKKRALVVLLVVLVASMYLFTGCGKSSEDVIAGFNEILKSETTDVDGGREKLAEIEKYLDANLKYVDEKDADYMIFEYLEEAYLIDNSYVVYSDVSDRYSAHLSELLKSLLELEILDEEKPLTIESEGGKLSGDWSDISDRALFAERIINDNEEIIKSSDYEYMKEHILWHYQYYISLMLIGTSSNPLFSYETGEFDAVAEDMYTVVMQKNPDSVTAWALSEYFTYLDSIGYELDYKNPSESKVYYDTCNYIKAEAGKRVI